MMLDELLDRASITPNCDVDCFPSASDFTESKLAVSLGSSRVDVAGADAGKGTIGVDSPVYLGVGQNAPPTGAPAVIRITGPITRCLYGATIAAGDRLRMDPATSRMVPFDCDSGDGHTHRIVTRIVRRVVYVTDEKGEAITGADPGDFVTTLERDDTGSLNPTSETVTVSEIGSGRYYVSFTPAEFSMYLLTVEFPDCIVTPPGFQVDAPGYGGTPVELSMKLITGRALVAGVDGDEGVMLLQTQIF
jgi:hypothetical protein